MDLTLNNVLNKCTRIRSDFRLKRVITKESRREKRFQMQISKPILNPVLEVPWAKKIDKPQLSKGYPDVALNLKKNLYPIDLRKNEEIQKSQFAAHKTAAAVQLQHDVEELSKQYTNFSIAEIESALVLSKYDVTEAALYLELKKQYVKLKSLPLKKRSQNYHDHLNRFDGVVSLLRILSSNNKFEEVTSNALSSDASKYSVYDFDDSESDVPLYELRKFYKRKCSILSKKVGIMIVKQGNNYTSSLL